MSAYIRNASGVDLLRADRNISPCYVSPEKFEIWQTQLEIFARTIRAKPILEGRQIPDHELGDELDGRLCQVIYNSVEFRIQFQLNSNMSSYQMFNKIVEICEDDGLY